MDLKKVRILEDIKGSPDGINVVEYHADRIYELPHSLATTFVEKLKVAEYLSDHQLEKDKINAIDTYEEIRKLLNNKYSTRQELRNKFKEHITKNNDFLEKIGSKQENYTNNFGNIATQINKVEQKAKDFYKTTTKARKEKLQKEIDKLLADLIEMQSSNTDYIKKLIENKAQQESFQKNTISLEENEDQVLDILSKIKKLI